MQKTVAKLMRLSWTQDFNIETLGARGHWARMEELLEVVKFHLPHYENTMKICKSSPAQVNPSDLAFVMKFIAMYLFIKVKGSRSMTYQYLTVDMIATGKDKDGFIDQKKFKTSGKYGFDSLILTDGNMQVLNGYISYVRPLLKPQCDFIVVNRNGGQRGKLSEIVSKLLSDVIGKYIHPTCMHYRQIVEMGGLNQLTSEEQRILLEDQKHSYAVAKVHCQKGRSCEVAVKAHDCLQKLQGNKGSELDEDVQARFGGSTCSSTLSVETMEKQAGLSPERLSFPLRTCKLRGNFIR